MHGMSGMPVPECQCNWQVLNNSSRGQEMHLKSFNVNDGGYNSTVWLDFSIWSDIIHKKTIRDGMWWSTENCTSLLTPNLHIPAVKNWMNVKPRPRLQITVVCKECMQIQTNSFMGPTLVFKMSWKLHFTVHNFTLKTTHLLSLVIYMYLS